MRACVSLHCVYEPLFTHPHDCSMAWEGLKTGVGTRQNGRQCRQLAIRGAAPVTEATAVTLLA